MAEAGYGDARRRRTVANSRSRRVESHTVYSSACHLTGDMFIACLKKAASFLKLKSGSACVTVPVDTRTEFALAPLSEEDNEADEAVWSWEGVYHSVSEFLEACRRDQDMPMPAVRAAHTILLACKLSCCM